MNILKFLTKQSKGIVIFSVLAGMLSGISNVALLSIINKTLRNHGSRSVLLWSFAGLCLLLPCARFISELLLAKLGQNAMYEIRRRMCSQILAAPLQHLEKLGTSRLLATLTSDVQTITSAVANLPVLFINAALVIGCLVYLGFLSGVLFLIVFGCMIVGIISYQLPILKMQGLFEKARQDTDTMHEHFRALTQGTKELKLHSGRLKMFVENSFNSTARSLRQHTITGLRIYSAASSWGQTLVFVVIGCILFLIPVFRSLSVPLTIAYILTLLYLMSPLQVIMNAVPQLGQAGVALKNVSQMGIDLASGREEKIADAIYSGRPWRRLELKSVTYAYEREDESSPFILGPLNLSFSSGELIFIIGGNGSGKTTLIKLLTGLYVPEEGNIYLDGEEVDSNRLPVYRQYFSSVFSDFYLFDQIPGTANGVVDAMASEYLKQLKLSSKVMVKDGRFSTTELSQGQRKRLALLSACMEDRQIYIFDEWAADQDPHFKNVFYHSLLPELKAKGKTIFIISHDDRYFSIADRVIKLDDGQVTSDQTRLDAAFPKAMACNE